MALLDSFGRTIRYLRVSVTDRCNLQCDYCRPAVEPLLPNHQEILTLEEMGRVVRLFVELGVDRIRLTGGEPLLRRNILSLVRQVGALPGVEELSMTTNAILLARYAQDLRDAGVRRINISLDTLTPEIFHRITRGGDLAQVLAGIDAALQAGLHPVKINMVVMRGVNEHEIADMVRFAGQREVTLRFIETMPVGPSGAMTSDRFISADEIFALALQEFGGELVAVPQARVRGSGPARYFRIEGVGTQVGIISARSRHFCDGCNRVRLTSRGELVLCLGAVDRADLKTAMRSGASDGQLMEQIQAAVNLKPKQHQFQVGSNSQPTLDMVGLGG